MADNEEDAKLIRQAFARAKKSKGGGTQTRGRGGNFGRYTRRRPPYVAAGHAGGAYAGAGMAFAQPPPPGIAPVVLPQPAAQYMPANPGFRGRGGGIGRGAPRACFRYWPFLFAKFFFNFTDSKKFKILVVFKKKKKK